MRKCLACMIVLAGLAGCASNQSPVVKTSTASAAPTLSSGIDLQYVDSSVRPQDDPYQYLNGKWLSTFQLP
ncbi:MAG: peptidase, partial [Gammaproteobacteria bacterium]|nr:peptidase [Gammaproteobacteria bacterium]